ncbi:hypothetical protein [Brevundimonas aveniformis]|uniref:hypothetical protein n=1 Tax=Brevundimonas aveniformis TaxID=370977 RepID=UPI0012EB862A|nr:hypothetical protein [Brevundimonas aveniformis]
MCLRSDSPQVAAIQLAWTVHVGWTAALPAFPESGFGTCIGVPVRGAVAATNVAAFAAARIREQSKVCQFQLLFFISKIVIFCDALMNPFLFGQL